MKVYLEGSPEEINDFLYGVRDDFNDTDEDDDPNIPIGGEEPLEYSGKSNKIMLNPDAVAELIRNALNKLNAKTAV